MSTKEDTLFLALFFLLAILIIINGPRLESGAQNQKLLLLQPDLPQGNSITGAVTGIFEESSLSYTALFFFFISLFVCILLLELGVRREFKNPNVPSNFKPAPFYHPRAEELTPPQLWENHKDNDAIPFEKEFAWIERELKWLKKEL